MRGGAGDDPSGRLVHPPERWYVLVRSKQDPSLAGAGLGAEIGLPFVQPVSAGLEPTRHLWHIAVPDRTLQDRPGETIDLEEDDPRYVGRHDGPRATGDPTDHAKR